MRGPPGNLKTPPYVTPQPVITHRKLDFLKRPDVSTQPQGSPELRFIVLATDGLWDRLSSAQVVSLVSGYLAGIKGTVQRSSLPVATSNAGFEGKSHKPSLSSDKGIWVFKDDNLATHLLRNSFISADGSEEDVRKMVSIPPPTARSFRDDISITVVWWEDDRNSSPPSSTAQKEKAKL